VLGVVVGLLALEVCYFFRAPEREISQAPNDIVYPADGKIIAIGSTKEDHFLKQECIRVSFS
jgi:phosphatidylserine decarboxylase